MRIQNRFDYQIEEHPIVWITLTDGCRLAARLWLPENSATKPVPAILEYLPYRRRDGTADRDALTHPWFAGHGYACLRVDTRGNGDSDGLMDDEYTEQELADGCEVIDWIASQTWCNGNVGMMGISWGGFNSLQIAARQPAALKAIVTLCSTDDRYSDDIHYKGGCLLNENLGWGATMLSYSSRPPDPAIVGEQWRDMWLDRLNHQPFLAADWLRHQTRDSYWQHGSVCEDFSAIKVATFAIGGWGDAYKNSIPRLLSHLSAPTLGITGPWIHKYPHFAVPQPAIGFLQEAKKWWDHWLKGESNDIMQAPRWRAFLLQSEYPRAWYEQRKGHWITEATWPAADISLQCIHLNANGGWQQTPASAFELSVKSPHDTGMQGGEYCAIWLGPELPTDQRHDDAMSLCFDSEPLTQSMDIVGAVSLRVKLSADAPQAQIAVRLCDVHADGASSRVSYTVLNLCHRNGHEKPEPLVPGQTYNIKLQLDDIAYRVIPGNRIRVAISSTYWPLIWPSPSAATLTLYNAELHLPMRPNRGNKDECQFESAVAAPAWQVETLRAASNQRHIEYDQVTGITSLTICDDFGLVRDCEHGLESGGIAREKWQIAPRDPLSARAQLHWTAELNREGLQTRTETFSQMHCDSACFYLSAEITAWQGTEKIFSKTFDEVIPRGYL